MDLVTLGWGSTEEFLKYEAACKDEPSSGDNRTSTPQRETRNVAQDGFIPIDYSIQPIACT